MQLGSLTDKLEQIARELRARPSESNWIAQFRAGRILTVDQASDIARMSGETIRRRAEQAQFTDHLLGIRLAAVWLIDLGALLDMVEKERARHGRNEAESRVPRQNTNLWNAPQDSLRDRDRATA